MGREVLTLPGASLAGISPHVKGDGRRSWPPRLQAPLSLATSPPWPSAGSRAAAKWPRSGCRRDCSMGARAFARTGGTRPANSFRRARRDRPGSRDRPRQTPRGRPTELLARPGICPLTKSRGGASRMGRIGYDGETPAAPFGRADFDAVSEQIRCVLYDEEPEAETVRAASVALLKGRENRRQHTGAHADAGVANLDAQFQAATARGDEHVTAGRRVVNGVAYQVVQHAGQQKRGAEIRAAFRTKSKTCSRGLPHVTGGCFSSVPAARSHSRAIWNSVASAK
jgi:hypothetical protein